MGLDTDREAEENYPRGSREKCVEGWEDAAPLYTHGTGEHLSRVLPQYWVTNIYSLDRHFITIINNCQTAGGSGL